MGGGWPTRDNEGPPGLFAYLGASLLPLPDWTSCDNTYGLVATGGTVSIYSLNGFEVLAAVPESNQDPLAALEGLGMSRDHTVAVLTPGR